MKERARLRYGLISATGGLLLNVLLKTVRHTVQNPDAPGGRPDPRHPVIYVLWHGRQLLLAPYVRGWGLGTLASRSRDGEYVARILTRWGFVVARGSSSRGGGAGLRTMIRYGRKGRSLAFTPDGPRGPRHRMKPGPLIAAQHTGLPLIPVSAAVDRAWELRSWDRFLVPKPFARIRIRVGDPVHVPAHADRRELRARAREVEESLNALTEALDAG